MPELASSTRTKPKQYICYLRSKTFDDIDILNSHKKMEHGNTNREKGQKLKHPLV
jgi:hypothetical protein